MTKCERCSGALDEETLVCPRCGARHARICLRCGAVQEANGPCARCGGTESALGWDVSRAEMEDMGLHCFMPYTGDRNFDIYYGGNRDGGGYVFHNTVGYTGPSTETLLLPSLVDGKPIYGIWNEFFCLGDDFAPETYEKTFARMLPLRTLVLADGIREAFTYAFFGCCGLETLVLPKSIRRMFYDFYDLFTDGASPMRNGRMKTPVTICYRGSREDWAKVALTSRFWDYVERGLLRMVYDYAR